jgi:hypothetical protein
MTPWLVMMLAIGLGPAPPTPAPTGPAPAIYADGLVVRLVSLTKLPPALGATCDATGECRPGEAAGAVLVRVYVGLTATTPIALDVVAGTAGGIALFTGTDRRAAAIDCGYVGEPQVLCTDSASSVPSGVGPGREVIISEAFDVPRVSLPRLIVTVQPPVNDGTGANPLPAATFADAQTRLTG